jgi:methyl-accepting chemotaxis protein
MISDNGVGMMSLRFKMAGFCLLIGLFPLLFMGVFSVNTASESLRGKARSQLESVREIQGKAVSGVIATWRQETVMYSKVKEVYNAIGMLRDYTIGLAEEGLPMPVDTPEYEDLYTYVKAAFTPYVEVLGYEDALLIDDHGRVLFSVQRGDDLGADLRSGQFSATNLAQAWRKAVTGETAFADVAPYAPSGGRPAAFFAAPVYSYTGDILGVAALRLPLGNITGLMEQQYGTGRTGDSYLVGPDLHMRSDSRQDPEKHALQTSFAAGREGQVDNRAVQDALQGISGITSGDGLSGGRSLMAYQPVQAAGVTWALITSVSEKEAFAAVSELRFIAGMAGAVTTVVVILLTFVFLRRELLAPLEAMRSYVQNVAGGALQARMEVEGVRFRAEIGQLSQGILQMVSQLKEKLGFASGVLSGIVVPCVVVDTRNVISFVNPQLLALLELEGEGCVYCGKPASLVLQHGKDGRGTTSWCIESGETVTNVEREWRTEKGNMRHVRIDAAPLHDLDGRVIGAIALVADLTDIKSKEYHISLQNETMHEVAGRADSIAAGISGEVAELSHRVKNVSSGARTQVMRLEEAAESVGRMNNALQESAGYAREAVTGAETAVARAEEGARIVASSEEAMHRVSSMSSTLRESMHELGQQAQAIGGVLDVIRDIADQTNLLALNAAIEAARAGDAGRGFAVVADEVRKLAERTMSATNDVRRSVQTIQKAADENMAHTEAAAGAVEETEQLVAESGEALRVIARLAVNMGGQIEQIARFAEEHTRANEGIIQTVDEISRIARQTEEGMDESARSVEGLRGNASALQGIIEELRRS